MEGNVQVQSNSDSVDEDASQLYNDSANPVSYTHLDVYKRQVVDVALVWMCSHTRMFYFVIKYVLHELVNCIKITFSIT